jgi:hypothetical protein
LTGGKAGTIHKKVTKTPAKIIGQFIGKTGHRAKWPINQFKRPITALPFSSM